MGIAVIEDAAEKTDAEIIRELVMNEREGLWRLAER